MQLHLTRRGSMPAKVLARAGRSATVRRLIALACCFAGYLVAAEVGLGIPFRAGSLTPFWPAAAVSLTATLLWGPGIWPAILAADLFASILHRYAFWPSIGMAVGNTIEPLLVLVLLKQGGFDRALQRARDAVLLFAGALIGPAGAGVFWVLFRVAVFHVALMDQFYAWFLWVRSDSIGILLLAPCLFVWTTPLTKPLPRQRWAEAIATAAVLLAVNFVVFGASPAPSLPEYAVEYAPFAIIVWIALRFGTRGATLSTLVTAIAAISHTIHGQGPFAREGVLALHLFLLMATIATLTIAITIAEHHATRDALAHQALHDRLTDLPNRTFFMQSVLAGLARVRRHGGLLGVLFIDLDGFKIVNDTLGHEAGDELIRKIARRLKSGLRAGDSVAIGDSTGSNGVLARIAGDEFTVLLEDIEDAAAALSAAERIQCSLAAPFVIQGQEIFKAASIGIALSAGNDDPEDLLRDADCAMYRAKALGRGRCELFDAALHAGVRERLQLEAELRHAVERKEFILHYQPIVSLENGCTTGVEALIRWQRPGRGLTPPDVFLPVAESIGLIRELGAWALREACVQLALWRADYPGVPLSMAVNVSAKQFNSPEFVALVTNVLRETKVPSGALHLEITEGAMLEDVEKTCQVIVELQRLGVKIMLDDFGTGYSSMAYLQRFAVDALKIDRSFVSGVHHNRANAVIVKATTALAQALHMEVIAEGIETADELECVRRAGCEFGQGYLFSKPVEPNALTERLSQEARIIDGDRTIGAPIANHDLTFSARAI